MKILLPTKIIIPTKNFFMYFSLSNLLNLRTVLYFALYQIFKGIFKIDQQLSYTHYEFGRISFGLIFNEYFKGKIT